MANSQCVHEVGQSIRVTITFDPDDVRIEETLMGVSVEVRDCHNVKTPGAPALPRRLVRVALPQGMWPQTARITEGKTTALTRKATLVTPAQHLRPSAAAPAVRLVEAHDPVDQIGTACSSSNCRCCAEHDPGGPGEDIGYEFEHYPHPEPALPDEKLYDEAARDVSVAVLRAVDHVGPNPVVSIEIRPVRYTNKATLELVREITVDIPYTERPTERASTEELRALLDRLGISHLDPARLEPVPQTVFTSKAQATRYTEMIRDVVINPDVVRPARWTDVFIDRFPADYLIITDNQRWNAATMMPVRPVPGNMIGQFERLAQHKRSRGLSAKVVTIADIVGGRYGDFRTDSRDLPEVIRKFLKHVYARWGVAWVLLGGDVDVLPPRYTAGWLEGGVSPVATDPPPDNTSHWTGAYLKMHVVSPGTGWPGTRGRQLVNRATGQLIPFDATGATAGGGLGWYWTTSDYSTRSVPATDFVRVNGPAATISTDMLQWIYEENSIPTDFYYSSLQGWVVAYRDISVWLQTVQLPYVYQPAHDWDALDNGLYGQYATNDGDVDGVHWHTDVSVGRAPVQTEAEATTFVDKVISYETFNRRVISANAAWPRQVLFASSNWGDSPQFRPTVAKPPGIDRFLPGLKSTILHLGSLVPNSDWQLIAEISDTDRRELPYNAANPNARGWHFAVSATNHSVPRLRIPLLGTTLDIPIPTPWVIIHGSTTELNPSTYRFDPVQQDLSMSDQEQLRVQMASDQPSWNIVTRLYEDFTDLTPAQKSARPVAYLTSARLKDALEDAPHIVALSGHGNPDGCCAGDVWMARGLTNDKPGFIVYADACSTGASDSEDSFAEVLLTNPRGGAVAYVGNTRLGWIGDGDDLQRAFFKKLTTTRHLGLLNDSRLFAIDYATGEGYARWETYSLTLFGDPEMSVWRTPPAGLWPKIRWHKPDLRVPIEVEVPTPPRPNPPDPRRDPADYVVHVTQPAGPRGNGSVNYTVRATAGELVRVNVSDAAPGELTVTVTYLGDDEYAPHVQTLIAEGPTWLSGTVTEVSYREEGRPWTEVALDTTDGPRRLVVLDDTVQSDGGADHDLCVEAIMSARADGTSIALLVDRDGDGGRVERFRLAR